jgi:hypothetical protein
MRDKKKVVSEKTPEQAELEKHVDAMMDPKRPDEVQEKPAASSAAKPPEPAITAVTIPADDAPTTAPQLSSRLRKQITINDASAKPLSIDKLDELTRSITESDKPKKSKKSADKTKAPAKPEVTEEPETSEPAETDETAPEADITENSMELNDAQTDKAVDDIVAYEGDVMLAVADSTAEAHNRQFAEAEPEKRHLFSTVMWTLVALVTILIIALSVLLVMGDSLANKLGI